MKKKLTILGIIMPRIIILCLWCIVPQMGMQVASAQDLVLYNGNIVDVSNGEVRYNRTIHIKDGRIARIKPAKARVRKGEIDITGRFVVPGLIDSHTHYSNFCKDSVMAARISRMYMENGVTTVRDLGGNLLYIKQYEQQRKSGVIPAGPDIYHSSIWATGDFSMPSYHSDGADKKDTPWSRMFSVKYSTDEAIEKAVIEAKEAGVSGFKLYINYSKDDLARLIPIIRKHGLHVWAHSAQVNGATAMETAASGVEVMSHAYMIPQNYYPRKTLADKEKEYVAQVLRLMKENGVTLDATLALSQKSGTSFAVDVIKEAYAQGVTIVVGTDLPDCEFHNEMALLSNQCGISNLDLLRAATINGAEILGLKDKLGIVAEGAEADILVIRNNPLDNISSLKDILYTISNGKVSYHTAE